MEAAPSTRATLVDLLDRVLDRGLVINADIIISMAGVPLIGVNLRATLAGMETMLAYGLMQEWDTQSHSWALTEGTGRATLTEQRSSADGYSAGH